MRIHYTGIIMFLLFLFFGIKEGSTNLINASVLLVIALTYLRGSQKGESYIYTASLLAVIFALISLLTLLASYTNSLLLNEKFVFAIEWSLFGFVSVPFIFSLGKSHDE